jgi:hypothetical protein
MRADDDIFQEAVAEAEDENREALERARAWRRVDVFLALSAPPPRQPPSMDACIRAAKDSVGTGFFKRKAVRREAERIYAERIAEQERAHRQELERFARAEAGDAEALSDLIEDALDGGDFDLPFIVEEIALDTDTLSIRLVLSDWGELEEFAVARKNGDVDYKPWPATERKAIQHEATLGAVLAVTRFLAREVTGLTQMRVLLAERVPVGGKKRKTTLSPRLHVALRPEQVRDLELDGADPLPVLQSLGATLKPTKTGLREVDEPDWAKEPT